MRILLILILLFLCSPALAAKGFYLGVGIGQAHYDMNANTIRQFYRLPADAQLSESVANLNLLAAYRFDDFLSMELEFNLPSGMVAEYGQTRTKLFDPSGMSLTASLGHNITPRIRPYVSLGAYSWDISKTDSFDSIDSGLGLAYNVGFDINLFGGKERIMRLQWSHQTFDNVYLESAETLSLSVMFTRIR